jgi:NAD-dependent SIR2 family protein deacetylase
MTSLPTYSGLQNYHDTYAEQNYMAHVGWSNTSDDDKGLQLLLSVENIENLSRVITQQLSNIDPLHRRIGVTNEEIASVLSSIYRNGTRSNIGDIYSRYIIPQSEPRCDLRTICNQTIQVIVSTIRDEIETIEKNKKLTVWNTLYGDFNKQGLRAHAPIKIRRKHPQYMAFNMKY